ncbi:hypothetical protein CC78DRAFT_263245 [Lojkania enalia]|uniref:Fungal N-terminal domain-containing protein n=1 Tax=Lojkania enalia TaxID=147567 RepID=A0A9P4N2Z4_9PLEO|nr:hypothetical protein CC78DRAFT_263245 [Didymosphaeria enalia]
MSGLEVLAVVAAASQFCAHLLKITESLTELHEHIKHGPDRIRSYSKQLESLSCTIEFIQRNQKFHIDIVENLVKAISDKVDTLNRIIHTSFSDVRRRSARKYFRIPKERITERRIKESLAALVDDKINLIICITMATDVTMKDASDQRSIDMDVDMDKASLGKSEALEQPVSCADSQIVPYMGDSESVGAP